MDRTPDEIRAFHFWIQGYPKFYEPIAAAYFPCAGYTVLKSHPRVNGPDIERIHSALYDGRRLVGPELDPRKIITFLRGRKLLIPDLLVGRDGKRYLVEFKSWGGDGSGMFDLRTLKAQFMGVLPRSVWLLVDWLDDAPIAGKILVVSARSPDHDQVLTTLRRAYNTQVDLLYLDEIMALPQLAGIKEHQCRYLDAATAELKQALGVWPTGGDTT